MKSFFINYLGLVSSICLISMIGLTLYAIANCSIGFMIPAMILGVVALFAIKGDI